MRNPHAGYTVTTLHDHRSALSSQSKKNWPESSARGPASGQPAGQPRLNGNGLSNICDGSQCVSSNTLAQESKQDGVIDAGAAGLAGARGHRSNKMPYRSGSGASERRNVREHASRERRNGDNQHGLTNVYRTQTIQAAVVQYPIEQNYVASQSRQECDLLEFLTKVLNRLHLLPGLSQLVSLAMLLSANLNHHEYDVACEAIHL